jgi:hypothetical protein
MFLSQEHQQHGQAYKKNTGEDFFSVDLFPGRYFHMILYHRGHPFPPLDGGGQGEGDSFSLQVRRAVCSMAIRVFSILAEKAHQVNRFRPGFKQLLPFSGSLCYKKFIGENEYGTFYRPA